MALSKKSWKDVQDTSVLITFSIHGHSKLVCQGYTEQGHILLFHSGEVKLDINC